MLGSIDDLSSIRLARRLAQPAEAFQGDTGRDPGTRRDRSEREVRRGCWMG